MKCGVVANQKVRHVVGLLRELHAQRSALTERQKQGRENLKKLCIMHDAAKRELQEVEYPGANFTAEDVNRARELVAEAAARVSAVEQDLSALASRTQALDADCREAARVAEKIMALVGPEDRILREELDWPTPGFNMPKLMPGRV